MIPLYDLPFGESYTSHVLDHVTVWFKVLLTPQYLVSQEFPFFLNMTLTKWLKIFIDIIYYGRKYEGAASNQF